ncbi:DUF11 domain-containing protein [Meiothermus sp. QL-1]|uniref:beta strand repeat-containing protein n=1 Tax=Meiothermus sp. QL-1 TaxID=2058095 RepID=UPI000E0B01CE|nr:DUF11 domain-containing protein [Meiothermus sp. QL-1]RDI96425.1 DUF11 domain-containing protein [Meiothermus sp. QL-1]
MQRILFALALALGLALAQPTPAGTSITNQASAQYIDSAGQARSTTSNQVVTVVQQVYSLTITPNGTEASPGQTRTALAGATVYFAYVVSNTGNGNDTIALTTAQGSSDNFDLGGVAIYHDQNCNGTLDAGEPSITSLALTRQGTLQSSACVVVAATIPAGASNGQYGNLNLVGTSSGGPADNDNWARATATTAAALTAIKAASPTGGVNPGATITYTISGANTGGSAASGVSISGLGTGILIADAIPNGLTVSSPPTGTAGAGTVQIVYSTDGGATWTTTSPLPLTGNAAGSNRVGMFISGSGAFFPQGASYTFSFQATVPAGAAQGTQYTNTATVQFNDGSANRTVTSNGTTHTVNASYSVVVGPFGFPTGGASGTYSAAGYTITRSGDNQSIASVYNGQNITFYHTLRNTGNIADSYTLSVSGAPAGWSCSFRQSDHLTPISGPVGPIAPGSNFDFDLVCYVPPTYTSSSSVSLTVTATSTGNSAQSDTTADTIGQVVSGYGVDLARLGSAGDGNPANDNPPAQNANPGTQVSFPIEIVNTGVNPDTYNLSAPTLPAGWTVRFYPDTDCNGLMDSPAPSPVTNSGLVNPGNAGRRCFIAVVDIPTNAAPGGYSVNFQADSATDSDANTPGIQPVSSDTISTTVNVNLVTGFTLSPDRSGTVTSPGTITYTHNLTNSGNAQASVSISAPTSAYGWTYQLSSDGTSWQSSLSIPNLPPGGSTPVYIRVLVPSGEPIGRSETVTLTASASYAGGGSATSSVQVTTTIVGGELSLSKSGVSYVGSSTTVRSSTAAIAFPGDQIVYTVVGQNIGTGDLRNVRISDPLPAFTTFVSASATTTISGGTILYSTDGVTWSTTAPTSLAAGQSLYVGVDTNNDGNITNADVMPAGSSITLVLRVQVQ